jgi:outer membrane protein OmpA-like peptidoglycan-associated protein
MVRKIQETPPEAIVLTIETYLHTIAAKLSAADMRDRSLESQLQDILASIAALQYDRETVLAQKRTRQEADRLDSLGPERQMSRSALLEARYEEIRHLFTPEEAEIRPRDGQLVIRLKAMDFPVGQSVILPRNYPLLSKVQRALRNFEDVDLIIEGHTDSTGSDEANELLSEQRAEAVRHYLVMNDTLSYDKIIAVGYGATRPLAADDTPEGMALNRRIDLIITPRY